MKIRPLLLEEFEAAIKIRIAYWKEELASVAPNRLNEKDELDFMVHWINSAEENNDIRMIEGIFKDDVMMGYVGASLAEVEDKEDAVELNYLFVNEAYRGQGLSLKLIDRVLNYYLDLGLKNLIVYNHHLAPSNAYYRKLGGKVIRKDVQGIDHLNIDIFLFELKTLKNTVDCMLEKYNK